ncbi:MAG: hypothetical protein IKS48_14230 [Eubacterium sp.]|nr:hypothetical protein [Eubacterium sp.]
MRLNKGRISAVLIGLTILGLLPGCGKQEEPYSSPTFKNSTTEEVVSDESNGVPASITDALNIASYSDATSSDAAKKKAELASVGDALLMGIKKGNVYYNTLAGFKITVDGIAWKLLDGVEVASATGATADYIDELWRGYRSPYDEETSYAAIAYEVASGANIIVSYINPDKFQMPEFNANSYLKMAADRYEGVSVAETTFLGQQYSYLVVPASKTSMGERAQFAIDKEGLIVLITFTLSDSVELADAVSLLAPLYY